MTRFLNRLEFKFGRFAIPHITGLLVLAHALTYIALSLARDPTLMNLLVLDGQKVLQGEVWRLVTYMFIPRTLSPWWIIFSLYMLYLMGEGLEHEWGAFRLNLYYFIGMIASTVVAFFFSPGAVSNDFIYTSIFLAFATLFPDFEILIFFILPVKVKWLGWLTAVFLAGSFLIGSNATRCTVLISLANYFLFFAPLIKAKLVTRRLYGKSFKRLKEMKAVDEESFHRCKQCGRTEATHPEISFRIAKDGEEYCLEHLPSRQNIEVASQQPPV
jgi:membrane associated rhomboid family serine protease